MHNLKYSIVFIFLGLLSFQSKNIEKTKSDIAQNAIVSDSLTWKLLGQIKFIKKPHKEYGEIDYPIVNEVLKKKSGKKISMSGFIVPIDNVNYALSKNVFASCFFCGKAGPETIMGIKFKAGKMKLKTDQYVTLEGNFRVNENNVEDWIYHIEDAIITKGN
jgi:hypothetical protein